jgi:hypothetical protein
VDEIVAIRAERRDDGQHAISHGPIVLAGYVARVCATDSLNLLSAGGLASLAAKRGSCG